MSRALETTKEFGDTRDTAGLYGHVRQQLEEHPVRTLAMAAGVGFVLGGGMLGRLAGPLVTTGLRMGLAAFAAPLAAEWVEQLRGQALRTR